MSSVAIAIAATFTAEPLQEVLDLWSDELGLALDDEHGDALGGIPYTAAQFAALGTLIARRVHASTRPPPKVVVADCDHTLWDGTAAEDGPREAPP